MKKGNKKYLVVAVLLLLLAVTYSTYAIYKSSATGTAEATAAKWVVKVNNTDIVTSDTYTFTASDIVWNANENVAEGKVAPGTTGTIKLAIDTSEAEVAVDYAVQIGTVTVGSGNNTNNNFAVTAADNQGTIDVSSDGKTINLTVEWTATDSDTANPADMGMAGKGIEIPVTVTLKQHVGA